MTNREAIVKLKESVNYYNTECPEDKVSKFAWERMQELTEVYQLAIAALEKQEPEEPDKHVTDEETWFCPRCHVAYKNVQPYYCFRCGQKLKWETWQYQIEF